MQVGTIVADIQIRTKPGEKSGVVVHNPRGMRRNLPLIGEMKDYKEKENENVKQN